MKKEYELDFYRNNIGSSPLSKRDLNLVGREASHTDKRDEIEYIIDKERDCEVSIPYPFLSSK